MITATALTKALRPIYTTNKRIQRVVDGDESRVFYNDLTKPKDFCGSSKPIVIVYEDAAGGRSSIFQIAQANASAQSLGKFDIDVVPNHQIVRLTTEALLRTRNDAGAFLNMAVEKIDTGANNLANDIERQLFTASDGSIGRVGNSSYAVTTLDLATDADAKKFHVGMRIVFASTLTGALRDSGKSLKVMAVNRIGTVNQITVDANLNTVVGLLQNDYIFPEGDAPNAGSAKRISGLPDWLPLTVTATLFFGQNRTDDELRLGGFRGTGSYNDIVKAVVDNVANLHDVNAQERINVGYMNAKVWARLANQIGKDVMREPGTSARVGYQYFSIQGPASEIRMKPAMHCAEPDVWLLQSDTWALESMLDPVRLNKDDGLIAREIANESGLEVRFDSHCQLSCKKPGCNIRLTLS